ncbi:hypothetical protein [Prochlorococcus marinus]|uniref:hypothetical protein n=1 Tax=Prochlorococcus marinus TaxID=1219 RepID=UPI00056190FB|nr:hypothetical protein [Prochlorococcus marinus]
MPHKNNPVLKIDALRERKLISAINYLLGRSHSYRWDMPHWVKNNLTDYQDSYHSKLKKLQDENQ